MARWSEITAARAAVVVNLITAMFGIATLALALAANQQWADRHFLPSFAQSSAFQAGVLLCLRMAIVLAGVAVVLLVRPRVLRAIEGGQGRRMLTSTLTILLAIGAALTVTELVLRTRIWRANQEQTRDREPRAGIDPILGWKPLPNHAGTAWKDGRAIPYATDASGYRVQSPGEQTDFASPAILLAGESAMFGYGLRWPETIQAQLQAKLGVRTADLAVSAYGTDQAYLRLRQELPRFAHPVAVVMLFWPVVFDRNLDEDRPHLDSALRWHPAQPPSLRMVELARRLIRYRSESTINEGVAMTQAVLRATITAAESRKARALIVVPQFLPEDPREAMIRHRVLDAGHLPYLLVPLDSTWRLKIDRHPDARGARAIADALARRLRAG